MTKDDRAHLFTLDFSRYLGDENSSVLEDYMYCWTPIICINIIDDQYSNVRASPNNLQ